MAKANGWPTSCGIINMIATRTACGVLGGLRWGGLINESPKHVIDDLMCIVSLHFPPSQMWLLWRGLGAHAESKQIPGIPGILSL